MKNNLNKHSNNDDIKSAITTNINLTSKYGSKLDELAQLLKENRLSEGLNTLHELEHIFVRLSEWFSDPLPNIRILSLGSDNTGNYNYCMKVSDGKANIDSNFEDQARERYYKSAKSLKNIGDFVLCHRACDQVNHEKYEKCDAILLFFDNSRDDGLEAAGKLMNDINEIYEKTKVKKPIFLISSSKNDSKTYNKRINDNKALNFAKENGITCLEVICRGNQLYNVGFVNDMISRLVINYRDMKEDVDSKSETYSDKSSESSKHYTDPNMIEFTYPDAVYSKNITLLKRSISQGVLYITKNGNLNIVTKKCQITIPLLQVNNKVVGNDMLNGYVIESKEKQKRKSIVDCSKFYIEFYDDKSSLKNVEMRTVDIEDRNELFGFLEHFRKQLLNGEELSLPQNHDKNICNWEKPIPTRLSCNKDICDYVIYGIPGNSICADCKEGKSEWMDLLYGLVVCDVCAGKHRSQNNSTCKIVSIKLDFCATETLVLLTNIGNLVANSCLEGVLVLFEHRNKNISSRDDFFKMKYENKGWIRPLPCPQKDFLFNTVWAIKLFNHTFLLSTLLCKRDSDDINQFFPKDETYTLINYAVRIGNDVAFLLLYARDAKIVFDTDDKHSIFACIPSKLEPGHKNILSFLLEKKLIDNYVYTTWIKKSEILHAAESETGIVEKEISPKLFDEIDDLESLCDVERTDKLETVKSRKRSNIQQLPFVTKRNK